MLRSVTSWLCCWGDNNLPGPHRPWLVKKHLGLWGRCLVGNEGRGDLYPFFKLLPLGLGLLWWFGTASSGCGIRRGFGQGVGASASLSVRLYWPWKQGVCGYLPQDLRCVHFPQKWCYGHRLWCRGQCRVVTRSAWAVGTSHRRWGDCLGTISGGALVGIIHSRLL